MGVGGQQDGRNNKQSSRGKVRKKRMTFLKIRETLTRIVSLLEKNQNSSNLATFFIKPILYRTLQRVIHVRFGKQTNLDESDIVDETPSSIF